MTQASAWLDFYKPLPMADIRLFCFAHAGGGASLYREWAKLAGPKVEVCPIQLPGRETRLSETCIEDFDRLITLLDAALMPYLDKPFALFGHSFGALVAFELARRLSGYRGLTPVHFFASGCRAPSVRMAGAPDQPAGEADFIERMRKLGTVPDVLLDDVSARDVMLPALRADFAMNDAYVFPGGEPLACPLSTYISTDDHIVSDMQARAWEEHTSDAWIYKTYPGDHFYLRSDPKPVVDAVMQTMQG